MTIKEIETRAGMSRANVRFYEAEGLLSPARKENGYRDYSEADLRELRRIRLLRSLRVSLDDIRALQKGEKALDDVLAGQLTSLADTQDELELAKEICRAIRREGAAYGELEAEKYLLNMEKGTPPASPAPVRPLAPPAPARAPARPAPPPELKEDVLPRLRSPWRRWFARLLDGCFYDMLLILLLIGVFHIRPFGMQGPQLLVFTLFALLLRLFMEPAFLALFKGTPGKLLLGLRVTDNEGQRLTYPAALDRSFAVFAYAEGLHLPIVDLVRLIKSYRTCMHGEEEYQQNPWEYDTEQVLLDERPWRIVAFVAALALIVALPLLADRAAATAPANTGELTVAEFCENFNRLADYNGLSFYSSRLSPEGQWTSSAVDGVVTIYVGAQQREPDFLFTEEDGRMTGLRFSFSHEDPKKFFAPDFRDEASLAIRAYAGALARTGEERRQLSRLLGRIERGPFASVEGQIGDVRVTVTVTAPELPATQDRPYGAVAYVSSYAYDFAMTRTVG